MFTEETLTQIPELYDIKPTKFGRFPRKTFSFQEKIN